MEIIEFTDYHKPNLAQLKENWMPTFQHEPYMNTFKEENNLDIISIGGVHVEPMLYSNKHGSIDELLTAADCYTQRSINGGRALLLLQKYDLIKLMTRPAYSPPKMILQKTRRILRLYHWKPPSCPGIDDVDMPYNGNYALEAGLVPTKDSLILEDKDSPYANIVAVNHER